MMHYKAAFIMHHVLLSYERFCTSNIKPKFPLLSISAYSNEIHIFFNFEQNKKNVKQFQAKFIVSDRIIYQILCYSCTSKIDLLLSEALTHLLLFPLCTIKAAEEIPMARSNNTIIRMNRLIG